MANMGGRPAAVCSTCRGRKTVPVTDKKTHQVVGNVPCPTCRGTGQAGLVTK